MKLLSICLLLMCSCKPSASDELKLYLEKAQSIGKEMLEIAKGKSLLEQATLLEMLTQKYRKDSLALDILSEGLATFYSFAGEHKKVLVSADLSPDNSEEAGTLENLSQYEVVDATQLILEKSASYPIVMINEAHHISQHRVLTYHLLKGLWKQGYRYFAVETLTQFAEKDLKKGYVSENLGYYSREAIFTNLILKARAIGFKIISYDYKPNDQDIIEGRENLAAQTIHEKIFAQDPEAKILIHVGYAHIREDTKWLASKLKKMTGLEILTADQTSRMEKSEKRFEHPTYQWAAPYLKGDKPLAFVNKAAEPWSSAPDKWDITVFWPRTTYNDGRPSWARLDRRQQEIDPSWCKNDYPCMIEVYQFNHADEVPADRVFINAEDDNKVVFLPEGGSNILVITNTAGSVLTQMTLKK